ncbi:hypothetical protein PYCC9005_004442 [Savitreella phatthalungensis]
MAEPRIVSILPSSTVHTRLLLCDGEVPGAASGRVQIIPHNQHVASQSSFVSSDGKFIALIPLLPGDNEIQLLWQDDRSGQLHRGAFYVTYVPLLQNPPLKLVMIVAKDSPLVYDDAPNPRHPPTLETAIKKFRLAAYMWAAYTSKQMAANGFGERTFRLDEAWLPDSLSSQDVQSNIWRQTAKVLILRSKYTTAEIRDPKRAQQNKDAGAANSLFDIAIQTLEQYPETNGPREHVSAMFLDAHYEARQNLITGHAALGGGNSQYALAIFGSHLIFSWPACLEEIESCFLDTRDVDKRYCGIDGEGRKYFAACAVGIGAFMHETGHLYGCPHQESGVMLRDYPRLHRSFTTAEPQHVDSVVSRGVCDWHRLDILRFLDHPAFALPSDVRQPKGSITSMATEEGVLVTCNSGLRCIELYLDGHEFPRAWIETNSKPRLIISENELRDCIIRRHGDSHDARTRKLRCNIMARTGEQVNLDDVGDLMRPVRLPGVGGNKGKAFKSGWYGINDGKYSEIFLPDEIELIRVWCGDALDGIEVFARSQQATDINVPTVQLVGSRGGRPHDFFITPGERIASLNVRSGLWMDAVQFVTTRGRTSPWFGNTQGGSQHAIVCPEGYVICGIRGEVGDWLNKLGTFYTKI